MNQRPDHPSESITALILAGGQSSRMGQDKALVHWQGVPLLQRVCEATVQCCDRVAILSPWPERYQSVLAGDDRYQWLLETRTGEGPMVGLIQGLETVSTPWVLLLACDLPLLDPGVLAQWGGQLSTLPETTLAMVPWQHDSWEPLCGFYRRSSLPALTAFVEDGRRSFQIWLSQVSVAKIPLDDTTAQMLWNCNTPADLSNSSR